MEILSWLASVSVRSLGLAAAAALGMRLFRLRTPAERHAVWTLVALGMLSLLALTPLLPHVSLPVLPAASLSVELPPASFAWQEPLQSPSQVVVALSPDSRPVNWRQMVSAVYVAVTLLLLLRLAYSYAFTRKLVRASRLAGEFYESDWIVSPLTVGWLRPRILLPSSWKGWDQPKLEAVLAHERAHVAREDWAAAAFAAVNRCIFWFHPLAWWLERRLAVLAEQACDDAAIRATGVPGRYARALLDISADVRASRGRLNWGAMAMTKPSPLRERIERILDETREIPPHVTPRRWASLATSVCAAAYLAAALQFTAAHAQQRTRAPIGSPAINYRTARLTPESAAYLEQEVAKDPEDLSARVALIGHYLVTGLNEPRARHVLWLIEHHPEADVLRTPLLFNAPGPLQDNEAHARAAALWRRQAAIHANNPRVVLNAAHFFAIPGEDIFESERWVKRAREIDPENPRWRAHLAMLYAVAMLADSGLAGAPPGYANSSFAQHARMEVEKANDGELVWHVGRRLDLRPERTGDRARLAALAEYGKRLQRRAEEELGYIPPPDPKAVFEAMKAKIPAARAAPAGPVPLRRVDPVYPPAARQMRIQGPVRLRLLIGADGTVQQVTVLSGPPLLVQAAVEAVKQWLYSPQPMPALVEVEVPFQLSSLQPGKR